MAERPRDACSSTVILSRCCWRKCVESAILRGWVILRPNLRLKVMFHANIYNPLGGGNSYSTTMPLEVSHTETL